MDFLQTMVLTISMTGAYLPVNGVMFNDDYFIDSRFSLEYEAELSVMDRLLFVGFGDHTEAKKRVSWYLQPVTERYTVFAGIHLDGFEFRAEHFCQHPVESKIAGKIQADPIFAAADILSVTYKASFPIWH